MKVIINHVLEWEEKENNLFKLHEYPLVVNDKLLKKGILVFIHHMLSLSFPFPPIFGKKILLTNLHFIFLSASLSPL